jgi:hypothetical protein
MTLSHPGVREFLEHSSAAALYKIVAAQAQTLAFADTAFAVATFAVLMIPLVAFMKRQPRALTQVSFE